MKILDHTPQKVIAEMAVRLFVGSRDVPKDIPKAMKMLEIAKSKTIEGQTEKEKNDMEYFEVMLNRLNNPNIDDSSEFWSVNEKLKILAEKGQPNAMYSYGSELFMLCQNNVFQDKMLIKNALKSAHYYLERAAKNRLYSAFYYLGKMYEDGIYINKDIDKAVDWYVEGASNNNAYWYFQLSIMYLQGKGVRQSDYLHFKYLKRAAEEGYIHAQHLLGIAFFEGRYPAKDHNLSLAWFREAARNGYFVSLINAGDLLIMGSEIGKRILINEYIARGIPQENIEFMTNTNQKPNLLFGLSQYISAYRAGATYLEPRITEIVKYLRESGEFRKE